MYEKESTLFTKKEEKQQTNKKKNIFPSICCYRPGVNAAGST